MIIDLFVSMLVLGGMVFSFCFWGFVGYMLLVFFMRMVLCVCNHIVFLHEDSLSSRAQIAELERVNGEQTVRIVRLEDENVLLQAADVTLALTADTRDPFRRRNQALVSQSLFKQKQIQTPDRKLHIVDAAIVMCENVIGTANEEIDRLRALAFAMAFHSRLGANSPVSKIPVDLVYTLGLVKIFFPKAIQ
jgi:hypothetical protein